MPTTARGKAPTQAPTEVVVKGQENDAPSVSKPPLDIQFDPYESIRPPLSADASLLLSEPPALARLAAERPAVIRSEQIIRPWSEIGFTRLESSGLRLRSPFQGLASADVSWEVSVIDEEGHVFARFAGRGAAPETIPWDGRSASGAWEAPGHDYSSAYTWSVGGSSRAFFGEPLRLRALTHPDRGGLVVSLDSAVLFGPKRDQASLAPDGAALLRDAADLARRLGQERFELIVYGPDAALAREQARQAAKDLADQLWLEPDKVTSRGAAAPPSETRVDILLPGGAAIRR